MKPIQCIAISLFIASTGAALAQPTTPPVNVWAWGSKTSLHLSEMPKDLTNAISVSLGEGPIGIAARADGTVVAWGSFPQVPAELTNALVPAISLAGTVGLSYRIEYVNAVGPVGDWKELATVTVTSIGEFYFDVSAIGQPLRFYRLVELP